MRINILTTAESKGDHVDLTMISNYWNALDFVHVSSACENFNRIAARVHPGSWSINDCRLTVCSQCHWTLPHTFFQLRSTFARRYLQVYCTFVTRYSQLCFVFGKRYLQLRCAFALLQNCCSQTAVEFLRTFGQLGSIFTKRMNMVQRVRSFLYSLLNCNYLWLRYNFTSFLR